MAGGLTGKRLNAFVEIRREEQTRASLADVDVKTAEMVRLHGERMRESWAWGWRGETGNGAPSENQLRFIWERKSRHILFGGSAGGGKTESIFWRLSILGKLYPGITMMLGRKTFTHTRIHIVPRAIAFFEKLRERTGLAVVFRKASKDCPWWEIRFWNGSVLYLVAYDNPESFQGKSIHQLVIDEASHINQDSIKEAQNRVRGDNDGGSNDPTAGYPVNICYTMNFASGYLHDEIAVPHMAGKPEEAIPYSTFIECSVYDLEAKYKGEAEARGDGSPSYIDGLRSDGLHSEEELAGYAPPKGTVWPVPSATGAGGKRTLIGHDEFVRLWGVYDPDGSKGPAAGIAGGEKAYLGLDHGIGDKSAIATGLIRVPPGVSGGAGVSGTRETKRDNVLVVGALGEFYEPLGMRPHSHLAQIIAEMLGSADLAVGSSSRHMMRAAIAGERWKAKLPPHYVSWDPRMKHGKNQEGTMGTNDHPSLVLQRLGVRGQASPLTGPYQRAIRYHLVRSGLACGKIICVEEGTKYLRREIATLMVAGAAARVGDDPSMPERDGVADHACDALSYLVALVSALGLVDFGVSVDWSVYAGVDGAPQPGKMGVEDAEAVGPDAGGRKGGTRAGGKGWEGRGVAGMGMPGAGVGDVDLSRAIAQQIGVDWDDKGDGNQGGGGYRFEVIR